MQDPFMQVSKQLKLATIKRQSVPKQRTLLELAKEIPKTTIVSSLANSSMQNNNRNSRHQSDFSHGGYWVLLTNIHLPEIAKSSLRTELGGCPVRAAIIIIFI